MNPNAIIREIFDQACMIAEPYSALSAEERKMAAGLLARFEEVELEFGKLPHHEILLPMLLSKNGRYEEALSLTSERYRQQPNWDTAVAAANAARRAGDLETAVTMFTKGTEHNPNDDTCLLEIGDIRLEQDRFAEALAAYERALEIIEHHAWALPSAFYCRERLKIEGNWLASLREVANQEGCTCGMQGCLTSIFGGYGSEDAIARASYLLDKLDAEVL